MIKRLSDAALACIGFLSALAAWALMSATLTPNLPSPLQTWTETSGLVFDPFGTRTGETGLALLVAISLTRVVKGFFLAVLISTPLGFLLGRSATARKIFDPLVQMLRPISPLAWMAMALVMFHDAEASILFTVTMCAIWPTVVNTVTGLRSPVKGDNWIIRSLPFTFAGYRVSFGVAWMVMVASEVMSKANGIGGFMHRAYLEGQQSRVMLSIVAIGIVGFFLDRLTGAAEGWVRARLQQLAERQSMRRESAALNVEEMAA
ncbi:MAG: hypothetical protein HYZ37_15960 [Candidatus Solibacter usitatus]|nr:hypothetical protein [Candidatus Solibacter usitatus]